MGQKRTSSSEAINNKNILNKKMKHLQTQKLQIITFEKLKQIILDTIEATFFAIWLYLENDELGRKFLHSQSPKVNSDALADLWTFPLPP